MLIRVERETDRAAVYAVNLSAFGISAEAKLVDTLREQASPTISLVAEEAHEIVGHVMFSPAVLSTDSELEMMGLGPVAVAPSHQRQGIGTALVRAGLERCENIGCSAVVVLGHPDYYRRFGFLQAARFDLHCEFDAPEDAFMVLELKPGALDGKRGMVRYHAAFSEV